MDLQFEEDTQLTAQTDQGQKGSLRASLINFFISIGLAKSEQVAQYYIIGMIMLCVVIAGAVTFASNRHGITISASQQQTYIDQMKAQGSQNQ